MKRSQTVGVYLVYHEDYPDEPDGMYVAAGKRAALLAFRGSSGTPASEMRGYDAIRLYRAASVEQCIGFMDGRYMAIEAAEAAARKGGAK